MATIEEEIKQKAFHSQYLKAHVNILFTSSWLTYHTEHVFRLHNLTLQQYNLLRILRGSSPNPVSIKELMRRMIDKTSNASRLVDKLEQKGFVTRTTAEDDKRRVDVFLTSEGLHIVNKASVEIEAKVEAIFSCLSLEQISVLNKILDTVRSS
jgi:DNA-binding MarR family transcriptional regulator